jgi:hypothetical protein
MRLAREAMERGGQVQSHTPQKSTSNFQMSQRELYEREMMKSRQLNYGSRPSLSGSTSPDSSSTFSDPDVGFGYKNVPSLQNKQFQYDKKFLNSSINFSRSQNGLNGSSLIIPNKNVVYDNELSETEANQLRLGINNQMGKMLDGREIPTLYRPTDSTPALQLEIEKLRNNLAHSHISNHSLSRSSTDSPNFIEANSMPSSMKYSVENFGRVAPSSNKYGLHHLSDTSGVSRDIDVLGKFEVDNSGSRSSSLYGLNSEQFKASALVAEGSPVDSSGAMKNNSAVLYKTDLSSKPALSQSLAMTNQSLPYGRGLIGPSAKSASDIGGLRVSSDGNPVAATFGQKVLISPQTSQSLRKQVSLPLHYLFSCDMLHIFRLIRKTV